MRRIAIIAWKWKGLLEITGEWLQHPENSHWLQHIRQQEDGIFDEYVVCEPETVSIKQEDATARVVRVRLNRHSNNELIMKFLLNLISSFEAEEHKIFVFLHRRDGFTDVDIRYLLKERNHHKYFLFGEGRDYIYHDTQIEGLLGEDSQFFYQSPNLNQPEIQVADDNKKIVFQPHFDKVWHHYENEFHTKIFELKEDLLSHFFSLFPTHFDLKFNQYFDHLNQDKPLLWRVKSFMNDGCNCLEEDEKKELEKYEKEEEKSFIFDDCRANLAKVENIEEEYDEVVNILRRLLFDKGNKTEKTLRHNLMELNREFEALLQSINN